MAQLKIPKEKKLNFTYYQNLRGIDLVNDASECSRDHAADILNMIPDPSSGCPVKRKGWRVIGNTANNPVIASFHNPLYNYDLLCTKRHLYKSDGDNIELVKAFGEDVSGVSINALQGKIYISGFGQFNKITGTSYDTVGIEEVEPYVPNTIISRNQDGTGGTALEGVNALTFKRVVSFLSSTKPDETVSSTTSADYKLYPETEKNDHFTKIIDVSVMQDDGTWKKLEREKDYTVNPWSFEKEFYTGQSKLGVGSWDKTAATTDLGFRLKTAHKQVVSGQDDVKCTIYEYDMTDSGNGILNGMYNALLEKLSNSSITQVFGFVAMDRIFYVVDNNKIYYSEPYQPEFIPDDNYIIVGNSAPIVGLHKENGYMVVITSESYEYTIYMVQGKTSNVTRTTIEPSGGTTYSTEEINYFAAQSAISSTGAVASGSFCTLIDDPLFLSKTGIYGIQNNLLTSVTVIANRSEMINARLCDEPNLENAVATIYNGFYLLCVNKHVYLLDSRNRVRPYAGDTGYECYYLDNIDARNFLSYEGSLFFSDSNGNWCKFNTDIEGTSAYCDNGTLKVRDDGVKYIEEGHDEQPIKSYYVTRQDSDDYPQYFKTMHKRGCVVTLKPYDRTSVTAFYSKDGGPYQPYGYAEADIFNWEDIDFSRFTFSAATGAQDEYIRRKVKKYKRLQFKFENDKLFEPFGIIQFAKTWTIGNLAK